MFIFCYNFFFFDILSFPVIFSSLSTEYTAHIGAYSEPTAEIKIFADAISWVYPY